MGGRLLLSRLNEVFMKLFLIAVSAFLELAHGKIYDRCELARELKFVHLAPDHQLATWVCIAEHESQYNTSIVGHLSGDGSGDHGIFQISDQFWCSPPGKGLACGVTCAELEDDDISDDFICAQRIYREHKHISGDGFNAWAVYKPHCKGQKADRYLKDCFDDAEEPKTFTSTPPIAAHGFFATPLGRANKGILMSTRKPTSEPFLNFRSSSVTQSKELTGATPRINSFFGPKSSSFFQNDRFFASTGGPKFDFFTPTTTFKPTLSTRTTMISTHGLITATTQDVIPTTGRPTIFGFGKINSSPSTTRLFTPPIPSSIASQSSTISYPRPVFIVNGVKWY